MEMVVRKNKLVTKQLHCPWGPASQWRGTLKYNTSSHPLEKETQKKNNPSNRGCQLITQTFCQLWRVQNRMQTGTPSPKTSQQILEPPVCAGLCQGQVNDLELTWRGGKVNTMKPFQDSAVNQVIRPKVCWLFSNGKLTLLSSSLLLKRNSHLQNANVPCTDYMQTQGLYVGGNRNLHSSGKAQPQHIRALKHEIRSKTRCETSRGRGWTRRWASLSCRVS